MPPAVVLTTTGPLCGALAGIEDSRHEMLSTRVIGSNTGVVPATMLVHGSPATVIEAMAAVIGVAVEDRNQAPTRVIRSLPVPGSVTEAGTGPLDIVALIHANDAEPFESQR